MRTHCKKASALLLTAMMAALLMLPSAAFAQDIIPPDDPPVITFAQTPLVIPLDETGAHHTMSVDELMQGMDVTDSPDGDLLNPENPAFEAGAYVTMTEDLSSLPPNIDTSIVGVYKAKYEARDSSGNTTTAYRAIVVDDGRYTIDTEQGVILGAKAFVIQSQTMQGILSEVHALSYAEAYDFDGTSLADKITLPGGVPQGYADKEAGEYEFTWGIQDKGTTKTIIGKVVDAAVVDDPPVITLSTTPLSITLVPGAGTLTDAQIMQGVTAADADDDALIPEDPVQNRTSYTKIEKVDGTSLVPVAAIPSGKVGIYKVTYRATDLDGDWDEKSRAIIVDDGSSVYNEGYIISARSFVISLADVDTGNKDAQILEKSNAVAATVEGDPVSLVVNQDGGYTNNASGGTYRPQIGVDGAAGTVTHAITAMVLPDGTKGGNGDRYSIAATGFRINLSDANALVQRSGAEMAAELLDRSGATAYDRTSPNLLVRADVTIEMEDDGGFKARGMGDGFLEGEEYEYDVAFRIAEDTTATVPIKVLVSDANEPDAPIVYDPADIAAINAIIDVTGLAWAKADPADGTYVPDDWSCAQWSQDQLGKRVVALDLSGMSLAGTLDASALTALKTLDCSGNGLTALDVSGLTGLECLDCSDNSLGEIGLAGLSSLRELYCNDNQIAALSFAGQPIEKLVCYYNQLAALDVSSLTVLAELACDSNQIASLVFGAAMPLTKLSCTANQLGALDVAGLTSLRELYCSTNRLAKLDLAGLPDLAGFAGYGQEVSLTLAAGADRYEASAEMNANTVFGNAALSYAGGILSSTDSGATAVAFTAEVQAYTGAGGEAVAHELSGMLALAYPDETEPEQGWTDDKDVYVPGPSANSLEYVSQREFDTFTGDVYVDDVRLTEIEDYIATAGSTHIELLPAFLATLAPGVHVLKAEFMASGGASESEITPFSVADAAGTYYADDVKAVNAIIDAHPGLGWAKANPDDGSYLPPSWGSIQTGSGAQGTEWSADTTGKRLNSLGLAYKDLTGTLDVSAFAGLVSLYCQGNALTALDVSGLTALTLLNCSMNDLSELDVSGLTALTELVCYTNELAELDVSGLTALTTFFCSENDLTSLDVSSCTSLASFLCSHNLLEDLDVSGLTALTELDCSFNMLSALDLTGLNNIDVLIGYGQALKLTLTFNGSNYAAAVPMNDATTFGDAALSYSGGILSSTDSGAMIVDFTSALGTYTDADGDTVTHKLSGRMVLTYAGTPTTPPVQSGDYWEGGKNEFTVGSDTGLEFVCPYDFSLFTGEVLVDGVLLAQNTHYLATAGSTHIELLPSYLNTLSSGAHSLVVRFSGGIGDEHSQFTIVRTGGEGGTPAPTPASPAATASATPRTGDGFAAAPWAVMLLVAAGALLAICWHRRKYAQGR